MAAAVLGGAVEPSSVWTWLQRADEPVGMSGLTSPRTARARMSNNRRMPNGLARGHSIRLSGWFTQPVWHSGAT